MTDQDEFSYWNTMNIPHHLRTYGYIGLHCSDVNKLLKIIEERWGIIARVERDEDGFVEGKRKYLIVNPDLWDG